MQNKKASLKSQLEGGVCEIEDTEEMFWLSQSDDYQSKLRLADKRIKQYRYLDAADAFRQALAVKEDCALYMKLGGTLLTTLQFAEAKKAYDRAKELGADGTSYYYPLAIWYYLQGEYQMAAEVLPKCLPCDGEMEIAVLYWELLSSLQGKVESGCVDRYHAGMDVGHHRAYEVVVQMACMQLLMDEVYAYLDTADDLSYVVAAYGIYVILMSRDKKEQAAELFTALLSKESVWPCISYLAAYQEAKRQ